MSIEVKQVAVNTDYCRTYFVDAKGYYYAAQDEGIGSDTDVKWYTTSDSDGEPCSPCEPAQFVMVDQFTEVEA